jgi:hypothetical protein
MPNERGTQWAETRLLLQPVPPDDIRNITAIAKKLRRSVVIEEHFEFAIRGAHTVKISLISMRAMHTASSAEVPPYNRHSKYGVE